MLWLLAAGALMLLIENYDDDKDGDGDKHIKCYT